MYYWVFKETKKDSLAEVKKRNDIVVDFQNQIPDWNLKGFKPIRKFSTWMHGLLTGATANTIATPPIRQFKFKIPIFQTVEWTTGGFLVNGKAYGAYRCTFVAPSSNFNRLNGGVTCDSNVKFTYIQMYN